MKAIKSILVAAIPATFIIGCGGGGSNNTPQTNTLPAGYTCTKNNICGPLGVVNAELVTDKIKQKSRPKSNKQLNDNGADIADGILGLASFFFPELAPVVSIASIGSDFYNGLDGNVAQTTANLAESINQLNTQLNTLQSQVFNNQNVFYNYVTANESIEAQQAYNTVQNDINNIAGNMNNTVTMNYKYYTNSNWLTGQNDTPNNNYPNATSIAASYPAMNLLNSYTTSEIFGPALDNLSNSVTCSNNGVVTIYPYDSAAGCGNVNETSDIITLYNYLQMQLKVQLSQISLGQAPSESSMEATSLFNQYNNSIATIFENSLVALQTAYNIEANNNLLNYLAVTTGNANNQILPYNAIGSIIESSNGSYTCYGGCTSFYITTANPSTESSNYQMAYESAAANLTQIYVNRLNQLVLSTVPYIISDHFNPNQILPNPQMQSDFTTNPATISMFGNAYSVKSPQELYESTQQAMSYTTLNSQPLIPGGSWTLTNQSSSESSFGALFYQFSGLYDYVGCANATTTCASFFPNTSSAIYNGVTFSAYNVGLSYSGDHQLAPESGVLLSTPTKILNCLTPSTETFNMWIDQNYTYAYLACNDQLGPNALIADLTDGGANVSLSFINGINVYDGDFQNVITANQSTGNLYFQKMNDYNYAVAENILSWLPVTNPAPDVSTAAVRINIYLNLYGTSLMDTPTTSLQLETASTLGDGLFCYNVNPNTNVNPNGSNIFTICTSAYTGQSYSLGMTYTGNSNWNFQWSPYNKIN